MYCAVIYFCTISLISIFLTLIDKYRAKRNKWRIPESTLLIVGLLGGALCEYITMRLIHHKTLHKKFMIGLPAEISFHMVILILVYLKTAQII
ncbi:MAG: DUF1294 domain-containing protein [Eubacterium sp.]